MGIIEKKRYDIFVNLCGYDITEKTEDIMILGIDPAKEGAAVLYEQDTKIVRCVFSWIYRQRKKPIYQTIFTKVTNTGIIKKSWELRDGGIIAGKIAAECHDLHVGIEDAYVSRQNPRSGLRVARFGGELAGGISSQINHDLHGVYWVTAADWRYQLLGLNPFTKREDCKRISLQIMPAKNKTIIPHLETHGYLDHVTDALGVALWTENKLKNSDS